MDITKILIGMWVGMLATVPVTGWGNYARDFYGGTKDMWRNYKDMREANWKVEGTDKFFHAKANYEAATRGLGGRHAAAVISNAREIAQFPVDIVKTAFNKNRRFSDVVADYKADQAANRWGRNGGDPNKYRPSSLPQKYNCPFENWDDNRFLSDKINAGRLKQRFL